MIERKFISENLKEFSIKEYIKENFRKAGVSAIRLQKTPLGEKIVVYTSRPGLIVGRKGQSIRKLTTDLKENFNLENPQIEIEELTDINLNAYIIAERIANSLERYGLSRFKGIGHKALDAVMKAGALGVEILISGKIPSSRARRWRFYSGYLKKSGNIARVGVDVAYTIAKIKTGIVGIQVRIMPPDTELPDSLKVIDAADLGSGLEEVKDADDEKKESKSKRKTSKKSESKDESKEESGEEAVSEEKTEE